MPVSRSKGLALDTLVAKRAQQIVPTPSPGRPKVDPELQDSQVFKLNRSTKSTGPESLLDRTDLEHGERVLV